MLLHTIAKTGFEDYFHRQSANNNALFVSILILAVTYLFLNPVIFFFYLVYVGDEVN